MTGLEKYSRPILRDQVQDQDRQYRDQDQDQDRQCQYQDQDQDRQKTVSSGLETKTAVSRTTSLHHLPTKTNVHVTAAYIT